MGKVSIEDEIRVWKACADMCDATDRMQSLKGAEILTRVGVSISRLPESDNEADMQRVMEHYDKAQQIFETTKDGTKTHWYAILVHNIGVCHGTLGKIQLENVYMQKAVDIYEALGWNATDTYVGLLYELASSREALGDLAGGQEAFKKANTFFDARPTWHSKLRATYAANLGMNRFSRGDLAGALQALEIAERVHSKLGTLKSAEGQKMLKDKKEVNWRIQSLEEVDSRKVSRRLEILRRPSEEEYPEEGAYLQRAGR